MKNIKLFLSNTLKRMGINTSIQELSDNVGVVLIKAIKGMMRVTIMKSKIMLIHYHRKGTQK